MEETIDVSEIRLKNESYYYSRLSLQEIANKLGKPSDFIPLVVYSSKLLIGESFTIIINKTEISTIR